MIRSNLFKSSLLLFILNFAFVTLPGVSAASIVGTDQHIAKEQRGVQIDKLRMLLLRDDVREQMQSMGVDPQHIEERINAMTDAEIAELSDKMNELPAGAGAIEVIGIVFLVLLILELLDVTDVFTGL